MDKEQKRNTEGKKRQLRGAVQSGVHELLRSIGGAQMFGSKSHCSLAAKSEFTLIINDTNTGDFYTIEIKRSRWTEGKQS